MDCRKYVDTIFDDNGNMAVGFEDFYMATHLETESIIIKTGSITTNIEYISPKEALLYCNDN